MYPDIRANLQAVIADYKSGLMNLDAFKDSLWKVASQVVSIEHKQLRYLLQQAEAELDSLQFTVDDEVLFQETLKVVDRICNHLN